MKVLGRTAVGYSMVFTAVLCAVLTAGCGGDAPPPPDATVDDPSVAEGDTGTTSLVFTVTLAESSGSDITVDYATSDGTATVDDGDYTAASGTLTIPAGDTSGTIAVDVSGDTKYEADETITLTLANPSGITLVDDAGTGTITNDDSPPDVSIADYSDIEFDSGPFDFAFEVTLSAVSGLDVSVDYATSDGTATVANSDYEATTGTLTIPAGETTGQVFVPVYGDMVYEHDETFNVDLSNPVDGTIADGSAVGTILNDDLAPGLSIDNPSVSEGDSGTTTLTFTVTLWGATDLDATVDYVTVDGTAAAPDDYTAASGTLTIPAGQTSGTIDIVVNGETVYEADETFTVDLYNAVDAAIGDSTGVGTILNDDPVPSLSIADSGRVEGNAGTRNMVFDVTLSQVSGADVIVDYTTSDGTATVADGDYDAASGTIIIPAGLSSATVVVTINGDQSYELDETFTVVLSNPVHATLADDTAVGTIVNDDNPPSLSIDDVSQDEGNSGTTDFVFTVALSNEAGVDVSVDYATRNGSATIADGDYVDTNGTLVIPAGSPSGTITVPVNGDRTNEPDEIFFLDISNPTNAVIADPTGNGTIVNDDPTLSINDVGSAEGDSGTTAFTFTVSLSITVNEDVSVDYSTRDGTATVADNDYNAASGTLTIPAGDSEGYVTVDVNGDVNIEPNETFFVDLSNPVNATIADGEGQGWIMNDD